MEEISRIANAYEAEVEVSLVIPGAHTVVLMNNRLAELCTLMLQCNSIRHASLQMKIAYSHAWRLFKEAERTLGFPLITTNAGGGSELTPSAVKLLEGYTKAADTADRELHKTLESVLRHN